MLGGLKSYCYWPFRTCKNPNRSRIFDRFKVTSRRINDASPEGILNWEAKVKVLHNFSLHLFRKRIAPIIMTNSNSNNSSCTSSSSSSSCGLGGNYANTTIHAQVPRPFFLPALPMANTTRLPNTRDRLAQIIQEALEIVDEEDFHDDNHFDFTRVTTRPQ
jgi:hypothetical protein